MWFLRVHLYPDLGSKSFLLVDVLLLAFPDFLLVATGTTPHWGAALAVGCPFREDESRIRRGDANLGVIRHVAMNLLKSFEDQCQEEAHSGWI